MAPQTRLRARVHAHTGGHPLLKNFKVILEREGEKQTSVASRTHRTRDQTRSPGRCRVGNGATT